MEDRFALMSLSGWWVSLLRVVWGFGFFGRWLHHKPTKGHLLAYRDQSSPYRSVL